MHDVRDSELIRVAVTVLVLLTASVCASSQVTSNKTEPARFEVVSIRPVPPDSTGNFAEPAGTEFRAHAMELSLLIQIAFGLNANQIVVADWAQGKKFDIAAKTGSSVPLTYEQMKPLLQSDVDGPVCDDLSSGNARGAGL